MNEAKKATVRPQPLLAVRDVRASTTWYERVLGVSRLGESDHDDIYQQLLDGDRLILQLHAWDEEDHPNLANPAKAPVGHGVLIWFEVEDFNAAVDRVRRSKTKVVLGPQENENSGRQEIWISDPDGYIVVLASAN